MVYIPNHRLDLIRHLVPIETNLHDVKMWTPHQCNHDSRGTFNNMVHISEFLMLILRHLAEKRSFGTPKATATDSHKHVEYVSKIARLSCFKGNGCRYTGMIYIEYTHIEVLSSFGIVVGPCNYFNKDKVSVNRYEIFAFLEPHLKMQNAHIYNESDCCQLSKKLMLLSVLWSTIARCYVHKYVNLQAPRQTWTCSNDTWGIRCHNDMTVRNNPNVRVHVRARNFLRRLQKESVLICLHDRILGHQKRTKQTNQQTNKSTAIIPHKRSFLIAISPAQITYSYSSCPYPLAKGKRAIKQNVDQNI